MTHFTGFWHTPFLNWCVDCVTTQATLRPIYQWKVKDVTFSANMTGLICFTTLALALLAATWFFISFCKSLFYRTFDFYVLNSLIWIVSIICIAKCLWFSITKNTKMLLIVLGTNFRRAVWLLSSTPSGRKTTKPRSEVKMSSILLFCLSVSISTRKKERPGAVVYTLRRCLASIIKSNLKGGWGRVVTNHNLLTT